MSTYLERRQKKSELLKMKNAIHETAKSLECDVEIRKVELKRFTDEQATSPLQKLYSIRQSKLKVFQTAADDY